MQIAAGTPLPDAACVGIEFIPEDRVADFREMHTQLVRPSCERRQAHDGCDLRVPVSMVSYKVRLGLPIS
jgi:hypothetical protein